VLPIQWSVAERGARSLGMQPQLLDVRRPEELARAFDTASKEHAEAMVVALDGLTQANLQLIAELAAKHRLPSIFATKEYVHVGGLLSYGASDRAAHEVRAGHQPQGRQGAGPHDSAVAPVACGARDRLGAPDVRSSRT
jgi:putative ABC transport system substrate-binding protein